MVKFGYIRTSLDELNADNQRRLLQADDVPDENIYSDEGSSGATGISTRHQWQILRHRIVPEDVLVTFALDRLGRTMGSSCDMVIELRKANIYVEFLNESQSWLNKYLKSDPDSIEGGMARLVLDILGIVASVERDSIARRTRAGIARAKAEGKKIGGQNKVPEAQAEAIVADRAAGLSWQKLHVKYGRAISTCQKIVNEHI